MVYKICVPLLGILCGIFSHVEFSQSAPFFIQSDVAQGPVYREYFVMSNHVQLPPLMRSKKVPEVSNPILECKDVQMQIDLSTESAPVSSTTQTAAERGPEVVGQWTKDVDNSIIDNRQRPGSIVSMEPVASLPETGGQDEIKPLEPTSESTISIAEREPEEQRPNAKVTLYPFNNRRGESQKFLVFDSCVRLPKNWQDRVASVNTHGTCVQLCEKTNCRGKCVKVQPGSPSHNRLRDIDWDSRTASLKRC